MTGGPAGAVSPSGIRHVLFDADGVIQRIPGGWYTAIEPPDPAFFAAAAGRLAAEPASILFIDDSAGNVDGARAAGLTAARWELGQGHDVLLDLLAGHGVIADPGDTVR